MALVLEKAYNKALVGHGWPSGGLVVGQGFFFFFSKTVTLNIFPTVAWARRKLLKLLFNVYIGPFWCGQTTQHIIIVHNGHMSDYTITVLGILDHTPGFIPPRILIQVQISSGRRNEGLSINGTCHRMFQRPATMNVCPQCVLCSQDIGVRNSTKQANLGQVGK